MGSTYGYQVTQPTVWCNEKQRGASTSSTSRRLICIRSQRFNLTFVIDFCNTRPSSSSSSSSLFLLLWYSIQSYLASFKYSCYTDSTFPPPSLSPSPPSPLLPFQLVQSKDCRDFLTRNSLEAHEQVFGTSKGFSKILFVEPWELFPISC